MAEIDVDKFEVNGRPAPYIKFKHMKRHGVSVNGSVTFENKVEPCFIRADGSHGTIEGVTELLKQKKVLVGYGNLKMSKHGALKAFLDAQLGIGLDPQLAAVRESVMAGRIDEETKRSNRNK